MQVATTEGTGRGNPKRRSELRINRLPTSKSHRSDVSGGTFENTLAEHFSKSALSIHRRRKMVSEYL